MISLFSRIRHVVEANNSQDRPWSFSKRTTGLYDFLPRVCAAGAPAKKAREGYICKDDYYMAIAVLSKERSKDPDFQVGACIVNDNDRVVGIGYNGMPNGCSDAEMPWAKETDSLKNKHLYVCHAELNAIVNKNASNLKGCRLYCTLFPCCNCAKLITQSGIQKVIYLSDEKGDRVDFKASREIFARAGIAMQLFTPKKESIKLDMGAGPGEGTVQ